MQRIKIPGGVLTARQLEVLCDLAEEYSDRILHITTRQDVQLHYVHLEDTPALMRRLSQVGITTREACGNSVRNVTACQIAGVCRDETFDVTPYAHAVAHFLLGHPDTQDMGRKFKVAFSGCSDKPCGLTGFHDIGCIAKVRANDGSLERGFEMYVGGGLGPVPHASELLASFVTPDRVLPLSLAICRVFSKHGERENRSRARMKFLLKKVGIEEFRRLVELELAELKFDPRWKTVMGRATQQAGDGCPPTLEASARTTRDAPPTGTQPLGHNHVDPAFLRDNVTPQRQQGYNAVTVNLPLGDLTPEQGRGIAAIARRFCQDDFRTTVEQNIFLRWVRDEDVPLVFEELRRLGLQEAGASGITDVTACPGTDTCKLGISSSRGLAKELKRSLQQQAATLPESARGLHIKCSGCFNSCAQHHVADIGFLGVSRNVNGRRVPHFQLVVGGSWANNGREFGLAIGAIPSKRVPEAVALLTDTFARDRQDNETFQAWAHRIGRRKVKEMVSVLCDVPSFEQAPDLYRDWGDLRVYTTGDIGVGECAGEVISPSQFAFAESERLIFEAQIALDEGRSDTAADRAFSAMVHAARAACLRLRPSLSSAPDAVASAFDELLGRTGEFDAASPGGRFSRHYVRAREEQAGEWTLPDARQHARQRVEEAQLFIDAAHAYETKAGMNDIPRNNVSSAGLEGSSDPQ
jgi:sulfite reductase (ferredoxin)